MQRNQQGTKDSQEGQRDQENNRLIFNKLLDTQNKAMVTETSGENAAISQIKLVVLLNTINTTFNNLFNNK